jgi:thiol-disulfide isomerase/thioredoxin
MRDRSRAVGVLLALLVPAPWLFAEEERKPQPEAVDALLQIVGFLESGHNADRSFFPVVMRAFDLLRADHLQDQRVAQACLRRGRLAGPAVEPFFQALLAKSQNRQIRAYACWALARSNEAKMRHLERIVAAPSDRPEVRKAVEFVNARHDPEFVRLIETIEKTDKTAISAETEALLEQVITEFGDVPFPAPWEHGKRKGETLADQARPKLDALRRIAVGKVVPDIQCEDFRGKPMRLSDYRGKIMVLVFWGTWCGPCMGLIPHEKALVERLKDRPFALLGINSDSDRKDLQAAMEKEGVTWRSWWDGGKIGGPIAARWDVKGWPTIMILDEKGLIRYKNFPHHAHKELGDAVDSLVKSMTQQNAKGTDKR